MPTDQGSSSREEPSPDLIALVDAVVAAVDVDRADQVAGVRSALECLGLDEAFAAELRLSGVPSLTWTSCQFCSEAVEHFEIEREVV